MAGNLTDLDMKNWDYVLKTVQHSKCRLDLDLRNYDFLQCIGRGNFGWVYLAQHKLKSFKIATKVLMKDKYAAEGVQEIKREAQNQYRLKHPNILKVYGVFEGYGRICLFLEYASLGSLRKHLNNAQKFNDSTASKLVFIIGSALHYCHSRKIIHRDLKPDNVLITDVGTVKLEDFGCSAFSPNDMQQTFCGTSYYLAPEMILGCYNHTVDTWSLGVMCYEFVTGEVPFNGNSLQEILVKGAKREFNRKMSMSTGANDLIFKLLRKSNERLPLREALQHPWIMRYYNTTIKVKNGFIY